jgi:hypothetical protein
VEVLQMKQRPRIYYSESQKALMWERWRKGETIHQIAKLFDRGHSSIQRVGRAGSQGTSRMIQIDQANLDDQSAIPPC